jgi:hypothetical protein
MMVRDTIDVATIATIEARSNPGFFFCQLAFATFSSEEA